MLNDIYESNSNWLKAADLAGQRPIVTIATAEVKENTFNNETKKQIVLAFEGKEKMLGLNFTNAAKIAELTGTEDFHQWVGTTIKLYVEKVKFENRMVDAIRIFPELPDQARYTGPPTNGIKEHIQAQQVTYGTPPDQERPFSPSDDQIPF